MRSSEVFVIAKRGANNETAIRPITRNAFLLCKESNNRPQIIPPIIEKMLPMPFTIPTSTDLPPFSIVNIGTNGDTPPVAILKGINE